MHIRLNEFSICCPINDIVDERLYNYLYIFERTPHYPHTLNLVHLKHGTCIYAKSPNCAHLARTTCCKHATNIGISHLSPTLSIPPPTHGDVIILVLLSCVISVGKFCVFAIFCQRKGFLFSVLSSLCTVCNFVRLASSQTIRKITPCAPRFAASSSISPRRIMIQDREAMG